MPNAKFTTGESAFDAWRDDVMSGKPPTFFKIGTGELSRIEIGPGLVTLIGGAPGAGKTAFAMQSAIEAMRFSDSIRVLVCNVEMPPGVLLDRQLARLSGVDSRRIRHRNIDATDADAVDKAMRTLETIADRVAFVRPPFTLENVAKSYDEFSADMLILDYIQRIAPPGEHDSGRGSVNTTMGLLREFADAGAAVVVLSAVGRTKDKAGRSSYHGDGLNLASFRESSELEFGADDAFILTADHDAPAESTVRLKHLKSRHGECRDVTMRFDKGVQSMTPLSADAPAHTRPKISAALAAAWNASAPAKGDDDE
jgi:replicative DNA helicase